MPFLVKDWDNYVANAEEIARSDGFADLRDAILERAELAESDVVVDIGSGTGLLALPAAEVVNEVWAVDVATRMSHYLSAKAASASLDNIVPVVASAVSLPLVDDHADVVLSNYCFHHLRDDSKRQAIDEAVRILKPGGRLVFGDMMFRIGIANPRDRQVIAQKVSTIARRGPAGFLRLAKNGARIVSGSWEHPADADWWNETLEDAGLLDVSVQVLHHEGGIASARAA